VCFSIDDVHPGRSSDAYEAGGDCEYGALGVLHRLLMSHTNLRATLFVTPDWREIAPVPTRRLLSKIPLVRDRLFLTKVLPKGTMSLDKHPDFLRYVRSLPRTEIGLHGLHHVHRGPRVPVEFQDESAQQIETTLDAAQEILARSEIPRATGLQPPAWNTPPALLEACQRLGINYIAGARDIVSEVTRDSLTAMSGPQGMPLIFPAYLNGTSIVHLTSNFQATSRPDRALQILGAGGLLCVKAHIVKQWKTNVALDGVTDLYGNYLGLLVDRIDREFGDSVWYASMNEVADAVSRAAPLEAVIK
jgi:peptidoglycan/xylan/chitin deacetylase (PgdA/CDA1 family)